VISSALTALVRACDLAQRPDLSRAITVIADKVDKREWHLVVVGQTSSGKSTLVNTLLDETLLPEDAPPTTGTITFVETHADGEPRFEGRDRGGVWQSIGQEEFAATAVGGKYRQLRVAMNRVTPLPAGLVVVDTPGYNSIYDEHRQVLEEYLPNADSMLLVLNYRLGFSADDREFLTVMKKALGAGWSERLHVGINFCPPGGPDRRVAEMQRKLQEAAGRELQLHSLAEAQRTPRRLATGALWEGIAQQLNSEVREKSVTVNAARLCLGLAEELRMDLARREAVLRGKENDVGALARRIEEIRAKGRSITQVLDESPERLKTAAARALDDGLSRIVRNMEEELSRQTWVGIDDCVGYVRDHLVQAGIDAVVLDINEALRNASAPLDQKLEDLAVDLDELTLLPVQVEEPGAGQAVSKTRDLAAAAAARRATVAVLERFGGAAGPKAGVVNLAKTLVRRAGKLAGKRFPRSVYDQMGQVLRRLGITSTRVAAAAAAVMVEVAVYLYKVTTWKDSLRAVVHQLLGLPFDGAPAIDKVKQRIREVVSRKQPKSIRNELVRDLEDGIGQAIAAMKHAVEYDVARRVETLSSSFRDRQNRLTEALMELADSKELLSQAKDQLLPIEKGNRS